jgi:hypothetical protein
MADTNGTARGLERALKDWARLGDRYERSIGTSSELSSYAQLQTAGARVARYHRALSDARRASPSAPTP